MGRLLESKGLVGDPMVGSSPRTRWCGLPPGPWVFPSRPLLDPGNKKTNKLDPEGSGRRKTQEMPGETPRTRPRDPEPGSAWRLPAFWVPEVVLSFWGLPPGAPVNLVPTNPWCVTFGG